jgi:hypothetical protein
VKRLKAIELENAKLKSLLAERDLEGNIMREVNRKNGEPTGASRADPLRSGTWPVATTSLWAAGGSAFDYRLPVAPIGQAYLTPHEFKLHHSPSHDHPDRAISRE